MLFVCSRILGQLTLLELLLLTFTKLYHIPIQTHYSEHRIFMSFVLPKKCVNGISMNEVMEYLSRLPLKSL